jgi:hypothetical protein
MIDINWDEIFHKNSRGHPFWQKKKNEVILELLKVEPVDEKLGRNGYKESINIFFVMEGIIQNKSDSKFVWIYQILTFETKQRNYQWMSGDFKF